MARCARLAEGDPVKPLGDLCAGDNTLVADALMSAILRMGA